MLEIIGTVVGLVGVVFSIIELKSRWPQIRRYWQSRRIMAKSVGLKKESLRLHASPKHNIFVLKDASSDFNGDALISLAFREDGIYFTYYDTESSPFYLLTSFPVKLLLPQPVKEGISWEESGPSNNGFHVTSISRVVSLDEKISVPAGEFLCTHIETRFKYPLSYSGPQMDKKDIFWKYGVGPVKISVNFTDSQPCEGVLVDYNVMHSDCFWPMQVGNQWEYAWDLNRPNNDRNVSNIDDEVTTIITTGKVINSEITYTGGQLSLKGSDEPSWRVFQVCGSEFTLENGVASTIHNPNLCDTGWFSGDSTVILGTGELTSNESSDGTRASWQLSLDPYYLQHFTRGYLVFGCRRYFGGVHSKQFGARVRIFLNGRHIDTFGLKIVPPNHSDFFHRIENPKLSLNWPLDGCPTLYMWPLIRENLSHKITQEIGVQIESSVSWDIDYVAIVCEAKKLEQRVFLSHNWSDKEIARKLAKDLGDRGIGAWLDEAEIKLGDSLIEKIRTGIDTVEYLLVLLSNASVSSEWVKKEVDIAMNQEIEGRKVKVLPVLLEDCELPGFLKGKVYADLTKESNYQIVLHQIEQRLNMSEPNMRANKA